MKILNILISFLFWGSFIIFTIRGKVRIATSMSLFILSGLSLIIGLILIYAVPHPVKVDKYYPQIPLLVSFISFVFIILGLIRTESIRMPIENPPFKRWIFLVSGIIIFLIGITVALMGIYSFTTLGFSAINPLFSASVNTISSVACSLFLYLSTIYNSTRRPNLMRKIIILLVGSVLGHLSIIISLILIYSAPGSPQYSYPLSAGIGSIAILPLAVLVLVVRKEYYIEKVPGEINNYSD